eukprot:4655721-Pleurochrysis_carterae.AAC.1
MPRGSSKRAAENCDGESSTRKQGLTYAKGSQPYRPRLEAHSCYIIAADGCCIDGRLTSQTGVLQSGAQSRPSELATDTELLVIALLMAYRMPDGKLDEWVMLVLFEEERYEQQAWDQVMWTAPTTWMTRGIVRAAAVDSLTQKLQAMQAVAQVVHEAVVSGMGRWGCCFQQPRCRLTLARCGASSCLVYRGLALSVQTARQA